MNDEELRTLALDRLKKRSEFRNYLGIWLLVSILVTVGWAITGPQQYFWPAWPIAGMGIGALAQFWSLYVRRDVTEADVAAEVQRLSQPR
jgi:2TM domain